MLNPLVKQYLYNFNARELQQKETGQFIFDYPNNARLSKNNKRFSFVKNFFLKNNYVFISKHNRFADYPEHSHEFLEFNYMLDGSCTQIVNGHEVILTKGNLLLLNSKSRHEIKALSENDILINIIFPKERFDVEWLTEITRQNNALFQFLMQDISSHSEESYILFAAAENPDVQVILKQMINNYFTDAVFSNEMLRFFIPILFMELIGNTKFEINGKVLASETNEIVINSLQLISEEYETLTLAGLSKKLNYNKNYLSNLLRERTGSTFTELLNNEKLKRACLLLESTSLPVREISENVGISNLNYFYKIFDKKFHTTPGDWRSK